MRPISEFEAYQSYHPVQKCLVDDVSPQWLIVRGEIIPMGSDDRDNKYNGREGRYLAFHDPVVGFFTSRGELLHKVTHFHITNLNVK